MEIGNIENRINVYKFPSYSVAIFGFVCSIVCLVTHQPEGLGALFVMPLSLSVCVLIFKRAFSYWKENVGFIILFATIFIRYLVTPVLISLGGTVVYELKNSSVQGFRMALIISVFELFASIIIVDVMWTKYRRKNSVLYNNKAIFNMNFRLSFMGYLLLIAFIFLVVSRGNFNNVISNLSTWWKISEETDDIYTYDLMAIEIIKSIVLLSIISFFSKKYYKTNGILKNFYFFMAFVFALLNTMFYQYTQRTALAQLIISTLIMMIAFFPQKRKFLIMAIGVGGGAFVSYIFLSSTGKLAFETSMDGSVLTTLSKMAELYVSGPSILAKTYDLFPTIRSEMSFNTYLSSLINTVHIFGLFPFLRFISNSVSGVSTINDLFKQGLGGLSYILPNYSLCIYYVGKLFGWLLEIFSMVIYVKLLTITDKVKKKPSDGFFFYALTYAEILIGQAFFVNNFFLLTHAFTSLPFWLLIFAIVNNWGSKFKLKA